VQTNDIREGNINAQDIGSATKAQGVISNRFSSIGYISNIQPDEIPGYTNSYLVTHPIDGNVYWELISNDVVSTSNSYFEIRLMQTITYDPGVNQYFVYDFDMARIGNVGTLNFMSVTRSADGKTAYWPVGMDPQTEYAKFAEGEFAHYTIVFEVNTAKAYLFINGSIICELDYGFMSREGYEAFVAGNAVRHDGLRFLQNATMSCAMDNFAARYVTSSASLAGALESGDITLWNESVYDSGYQMPVIAPEAALHCGNGDIVYGTAADLVAYITEDGDYTLELFADAGEITVNRAMTVVTNGYGVTIITAAGLNATESEGKYVIK
jgi:hypothetical protein